MEPFRPDLMFASGVMAFAALGEVMGEIVALSPVVIALRSDQMVQSMFNPLAAGSVEPVRMVTEKMSAAAEATFETAAAVGVALGGAVFGGAPQYDAGARIARAATFPVRRRLRDNVRRLSRRDDDADA